MRIAVIGSGFGGLAAAIRCQAKGHHVEIFEKRDVAGGRAYVSEVNGHKFDNGPTIITAPWMIDELFAAAGKKTEDYVKLVKIDPFYKIKFDDGSCFTYNDNQEFLLSEIRRFEPRDVSGYLSFMKHVEKIYHAGFRMITTPFHQFRKMLFALPELIMLRSDRSVAALAKKYFRDERLQQVFSFHPLLIGGHPYKSTSVYALIHKLEQESGVWFAMGGTGALVQAFVRLFQDIGGKIHLNEEVSRIGVESSSNKVSSITLKNGETKAFDRIICNGEVCASYMNLIDAKVRRTNTNSRLKRLNQSMSLFVIFFGTNKRFDQIAHHEILMGPRYKGLLDDIFQNKVLADDFSLYLHRPTATDPSLAPAGCDTFYVLSPVPNLHGNIDWNEVGPKYRDRILDYLDQRHMPGLKDSITTSFYVDPNHFEKNLNSHAGAAFSVAPTLFQSAWFRPHNKSEEVKGLYFTGAGTHPGAGVPGVLASGKIAADLVQTDQI